MNEALIYKMNPFARTDFAAAALKGATAFWFVVALIGHWIFVVYVLGVFGPPILREGLSGLAGSHLPNGFVAGDPAGNFAAIVHVLLAAIIIGGGPLQLVPQIRNRYPAFHRSLGRTYLTAAVLSSLAGLYIVWTRGSVGNMVLHIAITGDGILILLFAAIALRFAIARDIQRHRRWAMRLFVVASGVWFFRVGLMAWTMMTGGAGIDFESFTGPFIYFWSFGQYLLPLAMLEAYFRVKGGRSLGGQLAVAGSLVGLTVLMGIGIFAATVGMWLPRL